MKNYVLDQGGCYVSKPKPEGDNTLLDLHYSSYHMKAEFNNCLNLLFIQNISRAL